MASLQDTIAQAQKQAGEVAATQANVVADAPVPAAPAAAPTPAPVVSVDQILSGKTGMKKRGATFVKPSADGMKFGKEKGMADEILVTIALENNVGFALKSNVRYGKPAQYASSYDGVTSTKGGAWAEAVQRSASLGGTDPYPAADVRMELLEEVQLKDKTLKVGTALVYDTSSPTRFDEFEEFLKAANELGLMGETIKVRVINREVDGGEYQNWGTLDFEIITEN